MIIAKPKSLKDVFEMTKGFDRLLLVGCDGCVSVTQVGGERQAEVLKALLEMERRVKGKTAPETKAVSILRQCDRQIATTALNPLIGEYDAIVCLGCGVGVQTLASLYPSKPVFPGNDTMFLGMHDTKADKFYEMCRACGDCLLHETGGICPITRCAKSLLNGPCGGQSKGKCEVGGGKNDCAWILIYNRLKERNQLELFTKFRPPRDYRVSEHPRELGGKAEEEVAA